MICCWSRVERSPFFFSLALGVLLLRFDAFVERTNFGGRVVCVRGVCVCGVLCLKCWTHIFSYAKICTSACNFGRPTWDAKRFGYNGCVLENYNNICVIFLPKSCWENKVASQAYEVYVE